ncbi:cold shock domain-containing protein [Paenibacillus sp. FSL L8-0436]|uniref:cold-shock protein n=1 Tax=Paenibacillus sp. FSL L8-0436 TaxID=2954686 RepID=UPI003158D958
MTLYPKVNTWNGGIGTGDELEVGTSLGKSTASTKPRRKPHKPSGRMTGYVKMYDLTRGFGFIRAGRDDYFFHRSAFGPGLDYLVLDETVHFDLSTDRAGRTVAKNITLV